MEHARDLARRIGESLFDVETTDIVFIVEGERLPAHEAVLGSSCEYFRVLLQERESLQGEIVLQDVPLRGFKLVMSYIYTGQLDVGRVFEYALVEALSIGHMYGMSRLETLLTGHICTRISLDNVLTIYGNTHHLKIEDIEKTCYYLIIGFPNEILKKTASCDLPGAALRDILSWDTFYAEEIEIFKAVLRWHANRQSEPELEDVLREIRLPLIDEKDLLTTVKDSGLISRELLADAIKKQFHPAERNFRGLLITNKNLATNDRRARLRGALNNEVSRYTRSPTGRPIRESYDVPMPPLATKCFSEGCVGFTIALSKPFFINHIKFEICDGSLGCSYYVEVSYDEKNWLRVIDYSRCECSSFQNLYFKPRVARYIRLRFIRFDENLSARITNIDVEFTTRPFSLSRGFYVPKENVLSFAKGAIVQEILNQRTALINYEDTAAANDSKWTTHLIGGGYILIKLPQPYMVSSMRMLLRSDKSQAYTYQVETSLNGEKWTLAADFSWKLRQSWQYLTFEERPVIFIKIEGTGSTFDRIFSCSQLECPAPPRDVNEMLGVQDHKTK